MLSSSPALPASSDFKEVASPVWMARLWPTGTWSHGAALGSHGEAGTKGQPGDLVIATIVLSVAIPTRRQADVAALGRQGWRKKHVLRYSPAASRAVPLPGPRALPMQSAL